MPRRNDIHRILIIGSGPIIIGQACEFDYSGTQACKALKEEGYRVVLINSNPATIMTDPEFADRTYIEPITPECVEKIIAREVNYFQAHEDHLHYSAMEEAGAPIGSGAVESLGKQLQRRLRGCGQFWGQPGLTSLLRLGVLVRNHEDYHIWN
jgi:hypothetical protein